MESAANLIRLHISRCLLLKMMLLHIPHSLLSFAQISGAVLFGIYSVSRLLRNI